MKSKVFSLFCGVTAKDRLIKCIDSMDVSIDRFHGFHQILLKYQMH